MQAVSPLQRVYNCEVFSLHVILFIIVMSFCAAFVFVVSDTVRHHFVDRFFPVDSCQRIHTDRLDWQPDPGRDSRGLFFALISIIISYHFFLCIMFCKVSL